ncbi:MAG TPA: winged helix-turn-helix domain-containing protein [Thermoanaerobaculia bacterium]|nr:winged helix-turn-helix domain-containing protein [Thermoanaerobaculia bacterium]
MNPPPRDPAAAVALHPSATALVRFGPFVFDRANRILSREGSEMTLPPRVVGVLEFLLERRGKVVSKQALLDGVWKGSFVTDTSLTEAVSLLRQALGDDPQEPRYIQTVHRRGYRFIAAVSPESPPSREAPRGVPAAPGERPPREQRRPRRRPTALAAAAAAVLLLAGFLAGRAVRPPAPAAAGPAARLAVPVPDGVTVPPYHPSLALSPDGSQLVYVGAEGEERRLFHRPLAGNETRVLPGSEGATAPFFSADGTAVGFFAGRQLKVMPLNGAPPTALAGALKGDGGSWGRDGTIVFSSDRPSSLYRVPAAGGEPERLATPDAAAGEVAYWWPEVLPNGRHVLFTIWRSTLHDASIAVLDLVSGAVRELLGPGAAAARFAPHGHLLWARPDGVVVAAPFDADAAVLTGPPAAILDQALVHPFYGFSQLAAGGGDTLVYLAGSLAMGERELVRLWPDGSSELLPPPPRLYRNLELAPDGERLAVTILDGARSDLWLADLADGGLSRLTFEAFNIEPVWSADGAWLAFASNREGPFNVYRRSTGRGSIERLLRSPRHQAPQSVSPDGRELLYSETAADTGFDLWVLDLASGRRRPLARTPAQEIYASFSPDGRWISYASSESGGWEVYVISRAPGAGKWQVSSDGGFEAFWSRDGSHLHYLRGGQVLTVPVRDDAGRPFGAPRPFGAAEDLAMATRGADDSVLAIRDRATTREAPRELRVVLGWPRVLGARGGE